MAGLDDLLGALGGAGGEGIDLAALQQQAGPLLEMLGQSGGLQGILDQLQAGGLGDVVNSWLGQGANSPISVDQLAGALGGEQVASAAGAAGVSPDDLLGQLGSLLPGVVDQLSPNGQLPSADQLSGILGGLLGPK